MRNKKGIGLILCGLLLLAAAFALTLYNIQIQKAAGIASREILEELVAEIPEDSVVQLGKALDDPNVPDTSAQEEFIPDYILNPNMDMPEKEVNGGNYIATLTIPSLELELPVNTAWNYENLKNSPCRFSGSAYTGDLVICAHNYDIHFGSIKYLDVGDSVILTDMDGNVFHYEVIETETLDPYAVEQMKSGDWDLTLFTCTVGGATRVTVRCELVQ